MEEQNLAVKLGGLTGLDAPDAGRSDEDGFVHAVDKLYTVRLGRQGEHLTQVVQIDCTAWLDRMPGCTLAVAAVRPGEGETYLADTTAQDGMISWPVRREDTAVPGFGRAEVRALLDGRVMKSAVFRTCIEPGLEGDGVPLPPAVPDWVQVVIDASGLVVQACAHVLHVGPGEKMLYHTIQAAVDAAADGDTIIVHPLVVGGRMGWYNESVDAYGKNIAIIGTDRDSCVIAYSTADYRYAPLQMSCGTLANMTILGIASAAPADPELGRAYCLHDDDMADTANDRKLLIRNCVFSNADHHAIGMALRRNNTVEMHDCRIESGTNAGAALYLHDYTFVPGGVSPTGQRFLAFGCQFINGSAGQATITMQSAELPGSQQSAGFCGCSVTNYAGGPEIRMQLYPSGAEIHAERMWTDTRWTLEAMSHGNNIDALNAHSDIDKMARSDISRINEGLYGKAKLSGWMIGGIRVVSDGKEITGANRIRCDAVRIQKGTVVKSVEGVERFKYGVAVYSRYVNNDDFDVLTDYKRSFGSSESAPFVAPFDCWIRVSAAYYDERNIDSEMINELASQLSIDGYLEAGGVHRGAVCAAVPADQRGRSAGGGERRQCRPLSRRRSAALHGIADAVMGAAARIGRKAGPLTIQ